MTKLIQAKPLFSVDEFHLLFKRLLYSKQLIFCFFIEDLVRLFMQFGPFNSFWLKTENIILSEILFATLWICLYSLTEIIHQHQLSWIFCGPGHKSNYLFICPLSGQHNFWPLPSKHVLGEFILFTFTTSPSAKVRLRRHVCWAMIQI